MYKSKDKNMQLFATELNDIMAERWTFLNSKRLIPAIKI
jgi:hypothetical protein